MKHKCPYLSINKFCTHKCNPPNSHRIVCGYKNCLDCELFLQWLEELQLNENNSLEWLETPIGAILPHT